MFTAKDGKQYMTLEESKKMTQAYIVQSAEKLLQDLRQQRKEQKEYKECMYV